MIPPGLTRASVSNSSGVLCNHIWEWTSLISNILNTSRSSGIAPISSIIQKKDRSNVQSFLGYVFLVNARLLTSHLCLNPSQPTDAPWPAPNLREESMKTNIASIETATKHANKLHLSLFVVIASKNMCWSVFVAVVQEPRINLTHTATLLKLNHMSNVCTYNGRCSNATFKSIGW